MSDWRQLLLTHRMIFGVAGCLIALVVAAVYIFVVPEVPAEAPLYAQLVLRYGHSLCWMLLAAGSMAFAVRASSQLVAGFAYGALISYAIFMLIFLLTKL